METANFINYYPLNYPIKMNGKLTYKVIIKDDYIRQDGTCALYLQIFLNGDRVKIPLNLSVQPNHFDKKKQRVGQKFKFYKDYNLMIEKKLSDINAIEVNYRLSQNFLTIEKLVYEITNPTAWICFVKFWKLEMERQKDLLKPGTWKQQMSALSKLSEFKESILFHELTNEMFDEIIKFLKIKKKNNRNTILTFKKNFKKYINIAQKRGISINIDLSEIKVGQFRSERTFLMPDEINLMYKYWKSEFINATHKSILSRFLFSCFTGLRISDIQKIDTNNFFGNYIAFVVTKTEKIQRFTLNESSLKFIDPVSIFPGNFTDECINKVLKDICKLLKITKKVTFHVGRHTFATNFLLCGGDVFILQKILGHAKIEETMIYVHIVDSIEEKQIHNMDEILTD